MFEMELENLEDMLGLFEEAGDDQIFLVGQINYRGKESVGVDIIVSTKANDGNSPDGVLVTYKEEFGTVRLPYDDKDYKGKEELDKFNQNVELKKAEFIKKLSEKDINCLSGVWKKCE